MNDTTNDSGRRRPRWRGARLTTFLLALAVLLVAAGGMVVYSAGSPASSPAPATAQRLPDSVLEDEYGIRIGRIAVVAAGGLVDVRFEVIDSEKASQVMHDAEAAPVLLVERNGRIIKAPGGMSHGVDLKSGTTQFMLYPNTRNALRRGDSVLVSVGGLQFGPVLAQ